MHIRTLHLKNIRCFEDITLEFKSKEKPEDDPRLNWNVILGENGDGKTTLLQAIAACLTDSTTAGRLLKIDSRVTDEIICNPLCINALRENL